MLTSIPILFNIQNEIKLNANWNGELYSSWKEEKDSLYIEPYVGLSLFPYINLKNQQLIKIFIGYEIKTFDKKISKNELFEKRKYWNLRWGFNINGKVKKGCFIISEDNEHFSISNSSKAIVFKKEPIKLETSCFDNESWNEIKIWWSPINETEKFLDKSGNLTIRFFLYKKIDKKIKFDSLDKISFKNPYFYFIKTKLNKKTIIKDIFSEEFILHSKLLNEYKDSIPIKDLFELNYLNFSINIENFINFINLFPFELIWEEIRKFKNNLNLNANPNLIINLIKLLKKEKLGGNIKYLDKDLKKYSLSSNNKKIYIPFYSFKEIIRFDNYYFNSFKEKDLINIFDFNICFKLNLMKLNIELFKVVKFKNETFNNNIYIETDFDYKLDNLNLKIEIIVPIEFFLNLKKLKKDKDIEIFFSNNKKYLNYA